jgi:hypothetical protein
MPSRAVFLVCLYDTRDHFQRAAALAESLHRLSPGEEIAVIFSNQDHLDRFRALGQDVIPLLLPPERLVHEHQITVKKLVGVKALFEAGYDYVAVVDAESVFIKPVDAALLCEEIWQAPIIGNLPTQLATDNLLGTLSELSLPPTDGLADYFTWFNEIPVYERTTFQGFWEWLEPRTAGVFGGVWSSDYTPYTFYLMLHGIKRVKPVDIRSRYYGLLEELPCRDDLDRNAVLDQMGTHWSTSMVGLDDKPRIKMLFNMDRFVAEASVNIKAAPLGVGNVE